MKFTQRNFYSLDGCALDGPAHAEFSGRRGSYEIKQARSRSVPPRTSTSDSFSHSGIKERGGGIETQKHTNSPPRARERPFPRARTSASRRRRVRSAGAAIGDARPRSAEAVPADREVFARDAPRRDLGALREERSRRRRRGGHGQFDVDEPDPGERGPRVASEIERRAQIAPHSSEDHVSEPVWKSTSAPGAASSRWRGGRRDEHDGAVKF